MTEENIIPEGFKRCECGSCNELIPVLTKAKQPARFKFEHRSRGKNNPLWKGGIWMHSSGYRMILQPEHPRANRRGYVWEHVVVLEKKLGRSLVPGEQAHHINHNKLDNRPENLTNIMIREHGRMHSHEWHRRKNINCTILFPPKLVRERI